MFTKKVITNTSLLIAISSVLPLTTVNATTEQDANFTANVTESLSVSITTPEIWASGNINEFLRNEVNVSVTSNNSNGFTASMFSDSTTNLTNNSLNTEIIPTLSTSFTRSSFPANYWGYSLGEYTLGGVAQGTYTLNGNTYGETLAGNDNSNYFPLVNTSATPITLISAASGTTSGSQTVYFGAKADATKAAGTYSGTVIISVVTDTISNDNPITPDNPVTPNTDTNIADNQPTYTGTGTTIGRTTNGATVYTRSNTSGSGDSATETVTTQINEGDITSSYPLGVVNEYSYNVSSVSPLVTGLSAAASLAAFSSIIFVITARRKQDEEDEIED